MFVAGHSNRAFWGVDLVRLDTGTMGSNPTQGMDVVCDFLCCAVPYR